MGLFDLFKKKSTTENEASHMPSSPNVVDDIPTVVAEDPVPLVMPAVDVKAYGALADALVDDEAAKAQLEVWFEDPRIYCAGPGSNRCLSESDCSREDVLWLALVDTLLDNSKQAVEIDWKADVGELVWALNSIERDPALHLDESDFPNKENATDCFDIVNELWNNKGWVLAYMDIDSDSYVLPILTTEQFEIAAPLAADIGKTLIKAHNDL